MRTTHTFTTEATTLEDWLTHDYIVEHSHEATLWVHEQYSIHQIGRRIIYNGNTIEIQKFDTEREAATAFERMIAPQEWDTFIGHDPHRGYFLNAEGEYGQHRYRNEYFDSLRRAVAAVRILQYEHGVCSNVWFDYSYGRGSDFTLVDDNAKRINESEHMVYV